MLKNNRIAASWDNITPNHDAQDRMLNYILAAANSDPMQKSIAVAPAPRRKFRGKKLFASLVAAILIFSMSFVVLGATVPEVNDFIYNNISSNFAELLMDRDLSDLMEDHAAENEITKIVDGMELKVYSAFVYDEVRPYFFTAESLSRTDWKLAIMYTIKDLTGDRINKNTDIYSFRVYENSNSLNALEIYSIPASTISQEYDQQTKTLTVVAVLNLSLQFEPTELLKSVQSKKDITIFFGPLLQEIETTVSADRYQEITGNLGEITMPIAFVETRIVELDTQINQFALLKRVIITPFSIRMEGEFIENTVDDPSYYLNRVVENVSYVSKDGVSSSPEHPWGYSTSHFFSVSINLPLIDFNDIVAIIINGQRINL